MYGIPIRDTSVGCGTGQKLTKRPTIIESQQTSFHLIDKLYIFKPYRNVLTGATHFYNGMPGNKGFAPFCHFTIIVNILTLGCLKKKKSYKMKGAHLLFLLFFAFTSVLQAQNNIPFQRSEISPGLEYAVPIGDFRERNNTYDATGIRYHYGIGGSVKYLYHVNSRYGLSLQAGGIRYYSNGSSFTAADKRANFTAIPIKLGGNFRYKALFAEPQLGLTYFSNNNIDYQNASTTYGLNIGAYITHHIVLSGNYERWNRGGFAASHIGIRLAYALFPERRILLDSSRKERALPSHDLHWHYDKEGETWQKHKTFKTLGWVSIGVGIPLTFLGLATAIAGTESRSIHPGTYQWLIGSGAVITVSSIPFFIFSHKYKKMARVY